MKDQLYYLMDHIKNALTKNKYPLKKTQPPPHFFPLKKYKKDLQKDPKNENKALIVIFRVLFVMFGVFFVFV
jgi:hypothetical protein